MEIKKFLNTWLDKDIEDNGCSTSNEYKLFQRNYKSVLKELGKDINFELYSFNPNHYQFSAVMRSNTTSQFYYISILDVRYFKNEWANNILYRTMEHDHDWTGGDNNYCSLEKLSESLNMLDNSNIKHLGIAL